MRACCKLCVLIFIGLSCTNFGLAGTTEPCSSAGHRTFDFWLGEWIVKTSDGKLAGNNHITLEYNKCVIHEHYTTPHGYSGESLNTYDATRKVWHQTWVDTDGTLLILEGNVHSGRMILEGSLIDTNGKSNRQRITWTPDKEGSVRQLWEAMDKNGKWNVVFDGIYTHQ